MQASNEEATVRSFGVPHRIRNAICPASTGIVSGVRGVGGLKLKLGTSRFAHARRPFFFVYMPVRNTNITNTTNNAHECCSTCVRPLVECQHTSRTRKRLTSKPRTVSRVSPTQRRHRGTVYGLDRSQVSASHPCNPRHIRSKKIAPIRRFSLN